MSFPDLLFSTQGRIGRATWWLGIVVILIFAVVITWVLWSMLGTNLFYTFKGRLMVFALTLLSIVANYCLNAKRFHDRNKPNVFAQIALVIGGLKAVLDLTGMTGDPRDSNNFDTIIQIAMLGVGIWYFIELGCLRGTPGSNEYGPDPLSRIPA